MGKLLEQKQKDGELARPGGISGRYSNVPEVNIGPITLPEIGVTRKERI